MMVQMAATNTVIQTIVDDEKRGRVMSFYTMAFLGTAPFGSLLAGAISTRIGAPQTVLAERRAVPGDRGMVRARAARDSRARASDLHAHGDSARGGEGLQTATNLMTPPDEQSKSRESRSRMSRSCSGVDRGTCGREAGEMLDKYLAAPERLGIAIAGRERRGRAARCSSTAPRPEPKDIRFRLKAGDEVRVWDDRPGSAQAPRGAVHGRARCGSSTRIHF